MSPYGYLVPLIQVLSLSMSQRHHDHENSFKGKHLTLAGLQFSSLVHYRHGWNHGSTRADIVLEKGLRVLHFDQQPVGRESDTGTDLQF